MSRIAPFLFFVLFLAACQKSAVVVPASPTISELRTLIDSGDLTSEEVVAELLRRATAQEGLNAFITLDAEGALARARELDALRAAGEVVGPLHGIPLVAKDNIHVAGLPNTAGTPGLRSYVPTADTAVIERLRDSGAIILGKTNMHELAFGITSDNAAFGSVRNPHDPAMIPGGSSGGTGAAISAGLAPAGLGTDTGGSVRIPAALTGIAGYRPSTGRYDSSGVTPISLTRDTIGFMAHCVDDLQLLDSVVAGAGERSLAGKLRLGVPRAYFYANLDGEMAPVIDAALAALESADIELVETEIPGLSDLLAKSGFPIALFEARRDLTAYLEEFDAGLTLAQLAEQTASPDVTGVFGAVTDPSTIPQPVYEAALAAREEMRAVFREVFERERLHALVFPTTPLPARPVAGSAETVALNGEQVPTFPTYIRNTDPASIAALPGISLPVGFTASGLPVGIELDGPENSDTNLLLIAKKVEQVIGFERNGVTCQ